MPRQPHLGKMPREHKIHSAAEERAERVLHQAEDENRGFYEQNAGISFNVSAIMTGVREDLATTLSQNGGIVNRIEGERVQSELYRAIQSNKLYETQNDGDSRNYSNSINVDYLESNSMGKLGSQFLRIGRGALSLIGQNNLVEKVVDDRFGPDRDVVARRRFVAERFRPIFAAGPGYLAQIAGFMGLPVDIDVMVLWLERASLTDLRLLRTRCRVVNIDFTDEAAYGDLMLLLDVANRELGKIGITNVYDHQTLRQFQNDMLSTGLNLPAGQPVPMKAQLMRTVGDTLVENSIYPLKNNPEGLALMAELQNRVNRTSAQAVFDEIDSIKNHEIEAGEQTEANINLINDINKTIAELRQSRQKLITSFRSLSSLASSINNEERRIAGPPALNGNDLKNANTRLNNLKTQQDTNVVEHTNLESNYQELFRNLKGQLKKINESTIPTLVSNVLALGSYTSAVELKKEVLSSPSPYNDHIAASNTDFADLMDDKIPQLLSKIKTTARITPFELLQRLLRRDYLATQHANPNGNPNANINSEEANIHATIKATLRVKDAENADLYRSSNDKAAEFLSKGVVGRGGDALKRAVSKGQNFLGIEAVNIKTMSADSLLEQIINSNADFHVFRGLNKYSTTRDLRTILNSKGKDVAPEVAERFAQTIEAALSQFKKVNNQLNVEVDAGDWDIEALVLILQRFKMERWNQSFMDKLEASGAKGNREHAFFRLLRESKAEEKRVTEQIREDVNSSDAMWRKLLLKDELKKVLDKDVLDGNSKLKQAGNAFRQSEIAKMEAKASSLPDGSAEKQRLQSEIANHRTQIALNNRQIADAKDLYDRVEETKKYIADNNLSRADKKEYLAQVGMTQVFDKMGTNFRFQRYWAATKKAVSGAWDWNRKKWLNADTAKSVASKTFSVARIAATPITTPIGWAWKAGTFPVRLVGRAAVGTVRLPGRFWRMMSKTAMRNYIRDRKLILAEKNNSISERQLKLQSKLGKVPYSWDKKRIMRQINYLEEQKTALMEEAGELNTLAEKSKINLASAPANDTKAPAKPVDSSTKKAA